MILEGVGVHSKHILITKCDIKPRSVEMSRDVQTFLYDIYVIYYKSLTVLYIHHNSVQYITVLVNAWAHSKHVLVTKVTLNRDRSKDLEMSRHFYIKYIKYIQIMAK
jgi:hypothetical protein